MGDRQYHCRICEKQATLKEGEAVPICCNREMEPLPFCTAMPDPEQARNYAEDEPCADGTGPKGK
ncbi:MAG TPA: hypothetical protein PLX50_08870 [Candidatus Aminicenantes bacterium]|nr:hypothetical protein [Acidobacteriota bacterium]HOI45708.1 hypothetical protein [Candidatus Aminicenantes bacterium]